LDASPPATHGGRHGCFRLDFAPEKLYRRGDGPHVAPIIINGVRYAVLRREGDGQVRFLLRSEAASCSASTVGTRSKRY
jgi:hypothetical protein